MNRTRLPARLVLAICGLAALAAPATVQAQEERIESSYRWIDRSIRAGPYAGYIFTSRGNLSQAPGPSPVFGGRFRIRISSPLSFEISAGYGSSDLYVTDPRLEVPSIVDTTTSSWLLAEAYIQLALTGARSVRGLQPYLLFGGGILQGLSEEVADIYALPGLELYRFEIGTTPSIGVGLGVEWDISERLGLSAEVRDHLWRFQSPEAFFFLPNLANFADSGVEAPKESFWTNNIDVSATLFYYF